MWPTQTARRKQKFSPLWRIADGRADDAGDIEVLDRSLLESARAEAERIHVSDSLLAYVLDIAPPRANTLDCRLGFRRAERWPC